MLSRLISVILMIVLLFYYSSIFIILFHNEGIKKINNRTTLITGAPKYNEISAFAIVVIIPIGNPNTIQIIAHPIPNILTHHYI